MQVAERKGAKKATPKVSREVKARIVRVVLEVFRRAPPTIAALSLELYSDLADAIGVGRQKRLFEGYVTELEARKRQPRLDALLSKGELSREEATEALEHAAAFELKGDDALRKLVPLVERALGLRLSEPRNDTIVIARDPVTSRYELVQGLILHTGIDGRLLKVQLVREGLMQRKAGISLIGLVTAR
jgi:hypothetical protein